MSEFGFQNGMYVLLGKFSSISKKSVLIRPASTFLCIFLQINSMYIFTAKDKYRKWQACQITLDKLDIKFVKVGNIYYYFICLLCLFIILLFMKTSVVLFFLVKIIILVVFTTKEIYTLMTMILISRLIVLPEYRKGDKQVSDTSLFSVHTREQRVHNKTIMPEN